MPFITIILSSIVIFLLPSLGLVFGQYFTTLKIMLLLIWLVAILRERLFQMREFDRLLLTLILLFTLWSAIGAIGNDDAKLVLRNIAQAAAIFLGGWLLIGLARLLPLTHLPPSSTLVRLVTLGIVIAVLILVIDRALEFPLRLLLGRDNHPSQYNRGIAHVTILMMPVLAYTAERRLWLNFGIIATASLLAITVGSNSTATLAAMFAVIAMILAYYFPLAIKIAFQSLLTLLFLSTPWLIEWVSNLHQKFSGILKNSAVHRLEIWNYMSARIYSHPWLGWGLGTAKDINVTELERSRYLYAGSEPNYPHNQLLQIWVETGLGGALLFLTLMHLVILSISRQKGWYRIFGYGTFTMALVTAMANYKITTDSWWDCLAVTVAFFIILMRLDESGRGKPGAYGVHGVHGV